MSLDKEFIRDGKRRINSVGQDGKRRSNDVGRVHE